MYCTIYRGGRESRGTIAGLKKLTNRVVANSHSNMAARQCAPEDWKGEGEKVSTHNTILQGSPLC